MTNIIDLPHELIELIVELSDDKSSLYLVMVLRSAIIERQIYLKNKFTQVKEVRDKITYRLPNGERHREYDLPAVIYNDGARKWYCNDKLGEPNQLIYSGCTQMWYYNNKLHRGSTSDPTLNVDLPAIIYTDGTQMWFYNGECHRGSMLDPTLNVDLPAVIHRDGTQEWWYDGKLHRENDKPAVIYGDGDQEWYYNGRLHRSNVSDPTLRSAMPAIIYTDGTQMWYYNGWRYYI